MTDKEILTKALEKAMLNNYDLPEREGSHWEVSELLDNSIVIEYGDKFGMMEKSIFDIIFSHDFAKAFWGEEKNIEYRQTYSETLEYDYGYFWQWHLQQMVLQDEPLKYLEKFL